MGACCSAEAAVNNDVTKATNPVAAVKTLEEVESATPQAPPADADAKRACFGAGCYWGTEKFFYHDFGKKNQTGSITDGQVGFMGPNEAIKDPTYAEVKAGFTSHVEVFEFEFSGGRAYYEALVRFFFQFHDPTTLKRQGNDVGTQYASVIFCYDQAQFDIATKVKEELQQLITAGKIICFEGKTVTTDIRRATTFYSAHKEHQDYLTVNPSGYCNHRIRFPAWPSLDSVVEEQASATQTPSVEAKSAPESAPVVSEPASVVEPAVEEPAVVEPAVEEPAVEEPAVEEPAVVEPAVVEPAVVEPAVEEHVVEEPAVVEPAVVEPAVEEPAVEEPVVVEPAVEEPVVVEPAVVEVAAEPTSEVAVEAPTAEVKVEEAAVEVKTEITAESAPAAAPEVVADVPVVVETANETPVTATGTSEE